MSYKPRWDNGSWNVICDVCGRQYKASELQLRWDGLMVCSGDWEPRQPQDFVHGVADKQAPPFARPEQSDYFIPFNYTQQPNEQIDISEVLAKTTVKRIGGIILNSQDAINGSPLNTWGLNVSGNKGIDYEAIVITETVSAILGRTLSDTLSVSESVSKGLTKNFSDSISISESLQFIEVERTVESLSLSESARFSASKGIAETISIAESLSTLIISPTALNGSALNSYGLD